MGNPKQKWTAEEEEALRAGVKKHGTGKWKNIQRDPEFSPLLYSRSNIDLKDKWRNLTVSASNGSIPRDKWRTAKPKVISDVFAAPLPVVSRLALPAPPPPPPPPPPPSATPVQDASIDVDDGSVSKVDVKSNSKYDPLIFEALSKANDPIGSDITTIVNLIEMGFQQQKHDVNPNLRKLVGGRLRNLVKQGKLEKVDNFYRMKGIKHLPAPPLKLLPAPPPPPTATAHPTPTPTPTPILTPKPRDPEPRQIQSQGLGDTVAAACDNAARFIADIENKSFVAAEAVRESERVSRMSEDANAFLELSKVIFEESMYGRILLMA